MTVLGGKVGRLLYFAAGAENRGGPVRAPGVAAQGFELAAQTPLFNGFLHYQQQLLVAERLYKVIQRTQLHGFDGASHIGVAGKDHHRQAGVLGF